MLDEQAARDVIARGARFVVSPTLDRPVVRYCRDHNVPCIPGAFTPAELLEAWRAGATCVKLFPASAVGPRYLREVLAPLAQTPARDLADLILRSRASVVALSSTMIADIGEQVTLSIAATRQTGGRVLKDRRLSRLLR